MGLLWDSMEERNEILGWRVNDDGDGKREGRRLRWRASEVQSSPLGNAVLRE